MFADDTKLYRTITSELDCDILQQDLNNVMDWGRKWLTNFNLHKCKSLSFGIQVKIKNIYTQCYLILRKIITWKELRRRGTYRCFI